MDFRDFLILEKRIDQISAKIEVSFHFDVVKTTHAADRSDFANRGLRGDNQKSISNSEMSEFVSWFKREIAEAIAMGEIENGTEFVIRSEQRELSMAVIASKVGAVYWKLIIKTVFRESEENHLKVSSGQLVLEK